MDYKTDKDGADGLSAKYAGQLAAYERAWRKFVAEQVTSALVSTRTKEVQG